ncbi:MAG: glutaminase A [Rhodococcus sp.]|nr:glutaminase A [Rhodococcus sp. (in: high G+C Gram-positive bacteria)]
MGNVVDELIERVYQYALDSRDGEVAGYIPELAAVPPDSFGICIATVDGHVYERGDTRTPLTIQSISKPFTYALALADRGRAAVADKIDVEPSGEPFNEISLDPTTEHPRNPMINAGAITSASLVAGADPAERFERIRAAYSAYAGRELTLNEDVYQSEARTGHRNRAIGYMLRSFDIITDDVDDVLDLYFRQCSIDVTCRDLSLMAATLANNGTNPRTGVEAAEPALVEHVLSVMATCGMYDEAGAWLTEVGMPAKSGVGGGIIAVLPGQVGIAVYSPRLDEHGNSVRGVHSCYELSRNLELHFLHVTRASRSSIRAKYALAESQSRMWRSDEERALLQDVGTRAIVYELHGDLLFAGAEIAVREMANDARGDTSNDENADSGNPDSANPDLGSTDKRPAVEVMIIDVRRVDDMSSVASKMLAAERAHLLSRGVSVALVDPEGILSPALSDTDDTTGTDKTSNDVERGDVQTFADLDTALQWGEDALISRHGDTSRPHDIELNDHPLIAKLSDDQREALTSALEIVQFPNGDAISVSGSKSAGLHLVLSGRVASTLTDNRGVEHNIITLTAGSTFGELPLLLDVPWVNDFHAHTDVTAAVLTPDAFSEIRRSHPEVEMALLRNLAARTHAQLTQAVQAAKHAGAGPLRT